MFEALIRLKNRRGPDRGPDSAFESTTVSLSTAVPRPLERRDEDRVPALLRSGKIIDGDGNEQLIKVRNMSAGGLDQNVDLGELLAGRKPRHGFRPRPPRLDIPCKASVRIGKTYYSVDVHDISLGGMKVEPIEEYCVGKKVIVVVESLRPVKGEVRWYSNRLAGIVFDRPLAFEQLSEWVGKRLELASLKASYVNN